MKAIDTFGVEFSDLFERDGVIFGRDIDENYLEICADFEIVEEE